VSVAQSEFIGCPQVYNALNRLAASERLRRRKRSKSASESGVFRRTNRRYLESLGWTWKPTLTIGSGRRVYLRSSQLPKGVLLVRVSRRLTAVIDGVIHDTHNCSRNGTRCVYGYFAPPRTPRTTKIRFGQRKPKD
jgi:hypothetical protein